MEFRLANREDLPEIEEMYRQIVRHMQETGVGIWDEVYPSVCFPDDIEQKQLYLLTQEGKILSACALSMSDPKAGSIRWENPEAKAIYLSRLGVRTGCLRQGVGGCMLEYAKAVAREKQAGYLRLFVVDRNAPALRFYEKQGFWQRGGVHEERLADTGEVLREYGWEVEITEETAGHTGFAGLGHAFSKRTV